MNQNDNVNHPQHYKAPNGLEAIDVIEAFTTDLNGFEATHTANALKYLLRWKHKNGLEDLKKARWYLDRLINKLDEMKLVSEDKNDFQKEEMIFFETKDEVVKAFGCMRDIVRDCGRLCAADIYDICNLPINRIDNCYGWDTLDDFRITYTVHGKYAIILPKRKEFKFEEEY